MYVRTMKKSRTIQMVLYEQLQNAGIEVLYDDRKVSASVMFSDADLMEYSVRIIASPRNERGCCEVVTRDKSVREKVALEDVFCNCSENGTGSTCKIS